MSEYKKPSFLENESTNDIHLRMLDALPDDIDTSQGGHVWNLTRPEAIEIAYMAEFVLNEAIKVLFPQFAEEYPEIMDYHAQTRGLVRKPAEKASGVITVTGTAGTLIPKGSIFTTIATQGEASIDFETDDDATIGVTETVDVPVTAIIAGTSGNVKANSIVINADNIEGIDEVTNAQPTTGGMDEESTESLQKRIIDRDNTQDISYGGTTYDYKRWAESVQGVGTATVIAPTDDSGDITIILVDESGEPVSEDICEDVYNYIMRPDSPLDRLAPINDHISVEAPQTIQITVTATVILEPNKTTEEAQNSLYDAIKGYLSQAKADGEVKYTKIAALLSQTPEVSDYSDLEVNEGTSNITIPAMKTATIDIDDIVLTEDEEA